MGEVVTGDFELTMAELRAVAAYVVRAAMPLLPHFEDAVPGDGRPRAALKGSKNAFKVEYQPRVAEVRAQPRVPEVRAQSPGP